MVASNLAFKEKNSIEPEVVVNESPVKWCAVALSDVVARGKRLEASVFDVEAKQAYMLLTHGKYPAVNLISKNGPVEKAYYGGRLKRHYVDETEPGAVGFWEVQRCWIVSLNLLSLCSTMLKLLMFVSNKGWF